MFEYRYEYDGDEYRVVIANDVVAIVGDQSSPGWCMGNFGESIDKNWLLENARLPGPMKQKRALAEMIVTSLAAAAADRARAAALRAQAQKLAARLDIRIKGRAGSDS